MERLTTIASIFLLSTSGAFAAGCMAEAAEEAAEQDTTQAEQADIASDADQGEATADEEAVGESSQALSVSYAPGTWYRPEIITGWAPHIKWIAVPHVSYNLYSTLHYHPYSHVVYRPCYQPGTWFVQPVIGYVDD